MREQLEHILRPPIPWRDGTPKTECGLKGDSKSSITFADFRAKFAREGQQRSALTTCMTCWYRAVNGSKLNEDWDHRPGAVVAREIGYDHSGTDLIDQELRALAILAAEHKEEFRQILTGLTSTVSLEDARRRLRGVR